MTEAESCDGGSWQIVLDLPDAAGVAAVETAIEPFVERHGATVSTFEIGKGPGWRVTIHCAAPPDGTELAADLAAAGLGGPQGPRPAIERIAISDWLAEYRRRARPVRIGPFFVYPSHHTDGIPAGALAIALDAGLAFGTGEHDSTRGCLKAFERLAGWGVVPRRALDLGCGSAILAIAMARLWPGVALMASDNDPVAVDVARANLADNGIAGRVRLAVGQGYGAPGVADAAPYDLIAANILADPLCDMAGELARHLAPGGHAVLSGILGEQADRVLGAHMAVGLTLVQRIDVDEWTTLVLALPRAGD